MGTVQKWNELLFDSLSASLRESKGVTEGNQWCAKAGARSLVKAILCLSQCHMW